MAQREVPVTPPRPAFETLPAAVASEQLEHARRAAIRPWSTPRKRPPSNKPAHNRADIRPGMRCDRLTVIGFSHKNARGDRIFNVRCDCGIEKTVRSFALTGKNPTRSCGCLRKEMQAAAIKIPNDGAAINLIFNAYRKNASIRGLSFELTWNDVDRLVRQPCHYCGDPGGNQTQHRRVGFRHNGIDRVANEIGYRLSNVVPCCKRCNRAKAKQAKGDFIEWARNVARRNP